MKLQTCRRHPSAGRFLATCSGCAQELHDIEQRNRRAAEAKKQAIAAQVRRALGFRFSGAPKLDLDETATRVSVWCVRTLNDVFARVGGTVTARQAERTLSDGSTYMVTEVTLTTALPEVGEVQAFTDWEPAEEPHGFGLPLIAAINAQALAAA